MSLYRARLRTVSNILEQASVSTRPPPYMGPKPYVEYVYDMLLDEWQCIYLDHACTSSRIAIAACRQSGKSTVTAGFAAWYLTYNPNSLVLIASKSLRQAAYFIEKIRAAVMCFWERKYFPEANKLSITLPNGATAVAIPCQNPDAGRGFSPDLVILDEAAFASEALLSVITPSLAATRGAIHMISSPNGPQGFFYDAVEGVSRSIYFQMQVTYEACPRISPDFLAQERVALGEIKFKQEYMAMFLAPEGSFFGAESLSALFAGEMPDYSDLAADIQGNPFASIPIPERSDVFAAFDHTDRVIGALYDA